MDGRANETSWMALSNDPVLNIYFLWVNYVKVAWTVVRVPCSYAVCISLGYDVIAQAQSGTGKTATFSIAILEQLDVSLRGCQALVLAPTRELAQQVYI